VERDNRFLMYSSVSRFYSLWLYSHLGLLTGFLSSLFMTGALTVPIVTLWLMRVTIGYDSAYAIVD
jgi:hypothetical protein